MLHAEIRQAVRSRLAEMHAGDPDTLLRDELGLCLGATRVDVAAINGQITGCEIKGARDRWSRIEHQMSYYNQVLDAAILVGEGHYAVEAVRLVPEWWGIWSVDGTSGMAVVSECRAPQPNPEIVPLSVAQLLWRDEAFAELQDRGLAVGQSRATRWQLWHLLVESLTIDDLRAVVRDRLRARQDW